MKFLCDAMLGHLGRKLRMAGYDAIIDKGQLSDRELSKLASDEGRILLTCDRGICSSDSAPTVLYLSTNDETVWAGTLVEKLGLNWTHRPFTRCLECNTELKIAEGEVAERIPEDRRGTLPGLYCATCDKVYWYGSHVARMQGQLELFKDLGR
jgi:uncharacterized protein